MNCDSGYDATISEQILPWQIKIQIAKPPCLTEKAQTTAKYFFNMTNTGHIRKKNQEHKGQQKTEVMQPSVFPK